MPDTTLIDPLGRSITLTDAGWHGHILPRYPEMRNHRRLVEQAVRTPTIIHRSNSDPNCRLYYGSGPRPGIMAVTVADAVRLPAVVNWRHLGRYHGRHRG